MATIGELSQRLDEQVRTLNGRDDDDTVQSHVAGWIILARPTLRAITALPVGGRKEKLNASLEAVLKPLATGPRKELPGDLAPARQLVEISRTVGAIADVLADTGINYFSLGLAGSEALRFEASLLASLHVTARWSRSTLSEQTLASTRHSLMTALDDLAILTEPWAMIPPANRASALDHVRLPNPAAPGIEGAVVTWADEAWQILHDRHRATGWSMQATAGTLALLSLLAGDAVVRDGQATGMPGDRIESLIETLARAVQAWRAAATWPPNLRLGGSTEDFRRMTRDLRETIDARPKPNLDTMRHLLGLIQPVGLLHATTMTKLVAGRELWIHGHIPGTVDYARKWRRVPAWITVGQPLAKAAHTGYDALDRAVKALNAATHNADPMSRPPGWPPTRAADVRATERRAVGVSSVRRGVER
jgi:hypothetical protein